MLQKSGNFRNYIIDNRNIEFITSINSYRNHNRFTSLLQKYELSAEFKQLLIVVMNVNVYYVETWTLGELGKKMEVSEDVLRKKITFWIAAGVIRETDKDCFTCSGSTDETFDGGGKKIQRAFIEISEIFSSCGRAD
jgi:hypothetical protein